LKASCDNAFRASANEDAKHTGLDHEAAPMIGERKVARAEYE
jgi:hypothetical protein